MSGYRGYSMSNNAVAAYEEGKKPLSKWFKSEILDSLCVSEEEKKKLKKILPGYTPAVFSSILRVASYKQPLQLHRFLRSRST